MSAGRRQAAGGVFIVFPLDILQWQILFKNLYAQITPMRALPLQTTLLTHSGTLHEQETCPFSAPPTEQLQVTVLYTSKRCVIYTHQTQTDPPEKNGKN